MATKRAGRRPSNNGHKNERRKSLRLRSLIDQFHARIQANRHDLDLQFTRLAQIQVEVDVLKQSGSMLVHHVRQTTPRRPR